MKKYLSFKNDIRPLAKLTIPLAFSGVIEASIGFFSTLFLAQLGSKALAAGALVTWLFTTLMVMLWGTLTSISLIVSHKHGEQQPHAVAHVLRDGFLLALLAVIPTFFLLWNLPGILLLLGQSDEIVKLATPYLHGLAWGVVPDYLMLILLQFFIGLGHSRTSMTFMLLWVPTAIFCIYVLMFGEFGAPRLDIGGIGWGMTVSYWITTAGLVVFIFSKKIYRQYISLALSFESPFFIKEILKLGIPMGATYCIEVGFFLALTLVMGILGNQYLAANQITLQFLGLLIAVVFSIAQGVTVRMGHKIGAKEIDVAQRTAYAGIVLSVGLMLLVSCVFWFFPEVIIAFDLDIHDPKNLTIVATAKNFLRICAIFQLLEAMRFSLFGALRALKDTNYTLLTSVITFWFIALPVGYYLSRFFAGSGLWWGLVLGAICGVLLLFSRFTLKIKRLHSLQNPSLSQ